MTAQGLRELLAGDALTGRELAVLHGAALGETAAQTGERLHLAVDTIKQHRKTAIAKLDAPNVTRACVLAVAYGMLDISRLVDLDG